MTNYLLMITLLLSVSCSFDAGDDEVSENRSPDEFWEQQNSEATCQIGNPCDF